MRGQTVALALCGIAMATVATGCSTTAAGIAVPATTTSMAEGLPTSSVASPTATYGAPKVGAPLDVSRFLTQPCAVLSPSQLRDFNLPSTGKPDLDSAVARNVGPACTWLNSEAGNLVGVNFITGNPNGLDDLYRGHQQGQFRGYWTETTVEDYPAVFFDATDGRPSGRCGLAVGVTDKLAVGINEHGRLKEKSCDRAKLVASVVVQTLKGGR